MANAKRFERFEEDVRKLPSDYGNIFMNVDRYPSGQKENEARKKIIFYERFSDN